MLGSSKILNQGTKTNEKKTSEGPKLLTILYVVKVQAAPPYPLSQMTFRYTTKTLSLVTGHITMTTSMFLPPRIKVTV
jgi:hypothetical protein